jgi:hypothetical protein
MGDRNKNTPGSGAELIRNISPEAGEVKGQADLWRAYRPTRRWPGLTRTAEKTEIPSASLGTDPSEREAKRALLDDNAHWLEGRS